MKFRCNIIVYLALIVGVISCQTDDIGVEEEIPVEQSKLIENLQEKSSQRIICISEDPPRGYRMVRYTSSRNCPLFGLLEHNAKVIEKITSIMPVINKAGSGCDDHYCIWIVGNLFGPNAYVDIRSNNGSGIIGTYRGNDRVQYVNDRGQDVITLRLRSSLERRLFRTQGLRVWVVNPDREIYSRSKRVQRLR